MNVSKYDISKYAAFFHDGSLTDIRHAQNKIELTMESAEMDKEDLLPQDEILLSSNWRLKGKLHLEGVKNLRIHDEQWLGILEMKYDDGEIFDLDISGGSVKIAFDWINYPPRPAVPWDDEFCIIKIEADNIWWEAMPDLKV